MSLELTTLRIWELHAANFAMVAEMHKLLPLFFKKKLVLYFSDVIRNFS